MFLKSCDSDSDFMQFHCACTTSAITGQTSCVCSESSHEVSTNLSSLVSTPIDGAVNGSISIDPEQFMFRGTIFGQSINVLVDSGATTSFLSKNFVDQHQIKTENLPPDEILSVRLGNDSLESVSTFVESTLFMGDNIAFAVRPHIMRLPKDCHFIAGLDWIEGYDAWLHPKSRRMNVVVEGRQHVIAHMHTNVDSRGFMLLQHEAQLRTYGAYKTANPDWDVQSCSKGQMKNLFKAFDRGNLSYARVETFDEKNSHHAAHIAKDADSDDGAAPDLSGRLGCEYQNFAGTTGKPGVHSRNGNSTPDAGSMDENVFKVVVSFHPDGKYTVCAGENEMMEPNEKDTAQLEYSDDTPCTCASIFPGSSASKEPLKNMFIRTQESMAKPSPTDHSGADVSAGKLPANARIERVISAHPQRKTVGDSASWADDESTYMQHVFHMSKEQKEALVGVFPIPEERIDATEDEYIDWCNRALRHEFGHFTCLNKIERWEPLESDPLLKLNMKPGMNYRPIKYRIPVHMLPQLKEFVRDMLEKNFIKPNPGTTFSAPMLVIKKPPNADGTSRGFRLVTDFRNLNQCLDAPQFHMPEVGATQEKLRGAKFLTTLDMKDGYWNAGVDKDSQDLLSFSTPWGTFSYQVVPQGLISSAAWFQNWTENKLRKHGVLLEHAPFASGDESDIEEDEPDEPSHVSNNSMSHFSDENNAILAAAAISEWSEPASEAESTKAQAEANAADPHQLKRSSGYVACYCDDLIIVSDSAEAHKKHILELFRILSDEKIYLQPAKSKMFCKYVRYLGMVVGNNCLLEDPAKIRAIVDMPEPKNSQTEIRGFLGMASFWRRFIAGFAGITQPLNDLLKKGVNVKTSWNNMKPDCPQEHSNAVFLIKKALISYPVLRHYDPGKPVWVITDASDHSIGGLLAQKDGDGNLYAISYVSRALHHAELNYSVQEKECLGIVFAIQKFRHYLLCNKFTIRCQTDHSSLVFLARPSESSGRIARWSMIMAEYDYSVEHIPGVDNHVPDQLSRLIERPDSDWTPLECDDDTDVTYPFLMCHPAVHRCLKQAIAHGPILNTEADRAWAPIEHKLNCAVGYANVNVSDASGLHFDELKNQYVHARQHQKHLGGQGHQKHLKYAAPSYRSPASILKFSKDDYLQCPEFRVVYGMLLKIKEHQAKLLAVLRNKKSTTSTEIRSTDKKIFSHDELSRNTDVTDSDLFSDMVATQVLDDCTKVGTSENTSKDSASDSDSSTNPSFENPSIDVDHVFTQKNILPAIQKVGDSLKPTDPDFWSREEKSTVSLYEKCFLEKGYLYRVKDGKELLCVPDIRRQDEDVRYQVFEQFHDEPMSGHRGIIQTAAAMRRRVYWKNMREDIEKYIRACAPCSMYKKSRRAPQGKRAAMQIPRQVAESYNIDFFDRFASRN